MGKENMGKGFCKNCKSVSRTSLHFQHFRIIFLKILGIYLNFLEKVRVQILVKKINKIDGIIKDQLIPSKLPIDQNVNPLSSASSLMYVKIPIPTPANELIAIPAKIK